MRLRAALKAIVVIAVAEAVLGLSLWWLVRAAPTFLTEHQVTAPEAIQRLAEMHAIAAAGAVVSADQGRLDEIIRHSSQWPEVVYVSIENSQGRILAHTDPAKIGRVWGNRIAAEIRATVKAPYDEVVAVIAHPAGEAREARVGHVRLGYVVDTVTGTVREAGTVGPSLWLVLGLAVLVAVPAGIVVARVITTPASELVEWPADEIQPLRGDDRASGQIGALRDEVERLKNKLDERSRRLEQRTRELDQHVVDLAEARATITTRAGEIDELRRVIAGHVEDLESLRQENADWQAVVRRLRAELDGRPAGGPSREVRPPGLLGRDAPVVRPPVEQDAAGESSLREVRTRHGRSLAHITSAVRGSLTSILGFSKLLLRKVDGPLTEGQAASVSSIHDAGLRLLGFVTVLAEYARAEAGTTECAPERVDLDVLLREVASELERSGAPVRVKLENTGEATTVLADRAHLVRILSALVQLPPGLSGDGHVTVAVTQGEATAALAVAHPGCTIAARDASTLLEPFAPEDGRVPRPDGHRIELALARSLATLNGGELHVDGREDTGVLFTLTIPRGVGS